jgi:hypothetical protein
MFGTRDVQLERVDAFCIRQDTREFDILVERAATDVNHVGGAQASQLGSFSAM